MAKLRIAQWTTGKVGMQALRAILGDPRLELVAVFSHSPGKVGQDAGTMCGMSACGIKSTGEIQSIIQARPDAVVYTPFSCNLDEVVLLLENGINVVSTNLFLECGGITGTTRARLEAACASGNSSLYITGVNPGWVNSVTAALTAVCRRIDTISIAESADVSNYASRETWESNGFGRASAGEETREHARRALISFRDAVERLAETLDLRLDETDFEIEYAVTSATVDLGFMTLEKGTNGALRAAWVGKAGGRERIRLSVAWFLTRELEENWPLADEHYRIEIAGEPTVKADIEFVAPQWQGSDWSVLTALPAVNAIPAVVAASPGILSLAGVELVAAGPGAWQ